MDKKKLFELDKIKYEGLEVIKVSDNEIIFYAGYYYVPYIKEGEVVKFHKIENSYLFGEEEIKKRFTLNIGDSPKHFYLKVEINKVLGEGVKDAVYPEYNDGKLTKFYDVEKVSIVDEQVSQSGSFGYPYLETVSGPSELSINNSAYDNSEGTQWRGPYSKTGKVFYIYLCSLSVGWVEDRQLDEPKMDLVFWKYIHPKNGLDDGGKGPFPYRAVSNLHDMSKKRFDEINKPIVSRNGKNEQKVNDAKAYIFSRADNNSESPFGYAYEYGGNNRYSRKRVECNLPPVGSNSQMLSAISPLCLIGTSRVLKSSYDSENFVEGEEIDPPPEDEEQDPSIEDDDFKIEVQDPEDPYSDNYKYKNSFWGPDLDWMDEDWSNWEIGAPWETPPIGE